MSDAPPSNPYADATGWVGLPPSSTDIAATAKQQEQGWVPVEQPGLVERATNFVRGHQQYEFPQIGPEFHKKAADLAPTVSGGEDAPQSAAVALTAESGKSLPIDKQHLLKSYQD